MNGGNKMKQQNGKELTMSKEQDMNQIGFVCIHGAGMSKQIWDRIACELEVPCLKIDFPGRNDGRGVDELKKLVLEDYVAYMVNQVEKWEVQRFVLVGHSLGG